MVRFISLSSHPATPPLKGSGRHDRTVLYNQAIVVHYLHRTILMGRGTGRGLCPFPR
jgi:hypothetical protein